MTEPTIRKAAPADRDAVAAILARAFHNDPIYRWVIPDDEARRQRLPPLMRAFLRHMYPDGYVEVAAAPSGTMIGAAFWTEPGRAEPRPADLVATLPGLLWAVRHRSPRLMRLGEVFENARPDTPHWYLFHLGADPRTQRRGVGTALLRSVLARLDERELPAYLECKPELVSYYGRFGFAQTGTLPVRGLDVVMRSMWREPRTS